MSRGIIAYDVNHVLPAKLVEDPPIIRRSSKGV